MNKFVEATVVSLFVTGLMGCATTAEQKDDEMESGAEKTQMPEPQVVEPTVEPVVEAPDVNSLEPRTTFAREAINDSASPLNEKIIYFEFNQSKILPEHLEAISNHARYLFDYTDAKLRLEGHADERGTREYNIALGERRAKAVRQLLLLQGASADQVSIISYGEELPAKLAHNEQAWALNRRVELVYEVK